MTFSKFVTLLIAFAFASFLVARTYEIGPVIWIKRELARKRAQEGADRRELIDRVRQLLPQANENNVVFSLHRESSTRGGSRMTVVSNTYYPRVYVVDGDAFWIIPMAYDRHRRSYTLGDPVRLTADYVKQVSLTGKPGQTLTYTFLVGTDDHTQEIAMDLTPFCFRKSSFYPFDFMQDAACANAQKLAEQIALTACNITHEQLEEGRIKDECSNYSVYAFCSGIFGVMFAAANVLPITLICFVAAFVFLGMMISRKQYPKISAVLVIVELLVAFMMLK